jgi:chemotaxis protein CheZ
LEKEGTLQQYIGFTLGNGEYTIPILKVREIINRPVLTKIPQSPPYIEGVTNLRGSIIPIVNLKKIVHLAENGGVPQRVIVVSSGRVTFGILVDGITGVINIDESTVEPPERFLNEQIEQIEGIAKLQDRLVVLLDTRKLLPFEDMALFEDAVDVGETEKDGSVEVVKTIQTMGGEMQVKELHSAKEYFEKKGLLPGDPKCAVYNDIVQFMEALVNQDYDKADTLMQSVVKQGQSDLFKELGKVTRKLHNAVKGFKESIDPRLKDMTETAMPNAIDRLNYVIDKTEEAANKTMGVVEKYLVGMDDLAAHIRKIKEPEETAAYLKQFKNGLEDDLTLILTTQSFQDLTGQTLKKVINLVSDIEEELVRLIATFGVKLETGTKADEITPEKVSQSGVDDLLKDFGF